jgi:hypothetical protein
LFQNSQLTAGRQDDGNNFFARNLRERIEVAQGFQFVAEKLEPHRPRAGERPNVENAAAQGDFTLLRDLGFRFAALLFEPFDQIEWINFIAAGQRTGAFLKFTGGKSFLQKRGDAGDDDMGSRLLVPGSWGQGDQRLEPVADGVGMREFAFMRQHVPSRVKQRRRAQPRLQILLKTLLRLEVVGHDDNRAARENIPEQGRKKRLRRLADTRARQHSAILQSPRKALHSGSFRDVSEQTACRRRCRVLRQAKGSLQ